MKRAREREREWGGYHVKEGEEENRRAGGGEGQ